MIDSRTMNTEGQSTSLSSSMDDDPTQSVATMTSGDNGIDLSFLQARSLDAIPSRRIVTSVGAGRSNGNGTRGGRRRRATAPAHQSAASRTSATSGDGGTNDGGSYETGKYTSNCISDSSLLPVADDDASTAKHTTQPLSAISAELTTVTNTSCSDAGRASPGVSRILLANGTRAERFVTPLKHEGLEKQPTQPRRAITGRSVAIGVSAPTLLHDRHADTAFSSGVRAGNSMTPTFTVEATHDVIFRSAADMKLDCSSEHLCDLSPVNDTVTSGSKSLAASRRVGASPRGGSVRLSFDINPLRRWSHQRAVGTALVDCWASGSMAPDDVVGSAVSVYATPREQLTPERDPIVSYRSPPVGRPPPDVIGKAADAERAATAMSAGSSGRRASMNTCGQYMREQLMSFSQPSDNRLAMKLFGNKNAFVRDKLRRSQVLSSSTVGSAEGVPDGLGMRTGVSGTGSGSWLIHPCSNFRLYWDLFMLILLMANMITLPIAISFFNDDLSTHWIIFNGICDTVFLTDLIINFRTGIIADKFVDDIIMEPIAIAKHYLKTWFLVDLISSIPLDYIIVALSPETNASQVMHAGRALRMFRLIKLLSLLRLLRFSRLVRYITQWQEFLAVAGKFMRIFNLVCLILLMAHWNGCLQWLVPMLQDFPPDSWPALEGLQQADFLEQYTWALFKALSHMLCIGFGRYPPQSTTDVWLTIVSMLTGATCYALFVGHSTTVIQSFDTSKRLYREKFKQVEEYMMYRKLPRKLRNNITDYYEHRYRGKMFDETSILNEVNECLKEEIINYNCRSLVAAVPFFTHADHNFVSDVVTKLQCEVFLPGDIIIRYGTVGTKMYFIQEGIVDILSEDQHVVTSLSDGSYFGEICLLTNSRRVASVRAETYCNLFSLSVEHFHSVLDRYPDVRRTLETVAVERLNITARHGVTSPIEVRRVSGDAIAN